MSEAGALLVCATPIGNLGDVTARVLDALATADVILAEDTRVTSRLLARYAITTRLERYDAHTVRERTGSVVARALEGATFALVSDAGTPGISDPGAVLVDAALAAGVRVEVLPGPSAIITALVASGLPTDTFYFGGFLPRKASERAKRLAGLASLDATLVFYDSPNRCAASLYALAEAFPGREGAMARELTKIHEEVVRGPLTDVAATVGSRERIKGEVVLLVAPPPRRPVGDTPSADELFKEVERHVTSGLTRTESVKKVAAERGLPKKTVYEAAHRPRGD